jgi:hypothetical protein
MIMRMKYLGMLLTSLGVVTAVAAVPAQQDRHRDAVKSADAAVFPVKSPGYVNYSQDVLRRDSSSYGTPYYVLAPDSERGELSAAEGALAHESEQLKHTLERAKTDSERSDARTKLSENVGKQFDLRQKRHGLEIEALETQVKKLKELVRKRQESREDIISRRVDQILREADGLGW